MMMRTIAAVIFVATAPSAAETVRFSTKDGWMLAASYHRPAKGKPAAVLVHGVAAGKGEWGRFEKELWKLGLGTLAVDLRGHGESVEGPGGRRGFVDFDAAGEWPRMVEDVRAAVAFLMKRGLPEGRIALAGASIGANLVSRAASGRRFAWVMLLSPGEDYRGVSLATDLGSGRVLLAASPGDLYAYRTVHARVGADVLEASGGHGVQMFEDPVFLDKTLAWLRR